mmetsp:Transcript_20656/g.79202  ORF Transcript_20656/g.79202 Transcript_20656/m.79202 type:complete len:312 (+) Transcript_20656:563-1498(+)
MQHEARQQRPLHVDQHLPPGAVAVLHDRLQQVQVLLLAPAVRRVREHRPRRRLDLEHARRLLLFHLAVDQLDDDQSLQVRWCVDFLTELRRSVSKLVLVVGRLDDVAEDGLEEVVDSLGGLLVEPSVAEALLHEGVGVSVSAKVPLDIAPVCGGEAVDLRGGARADDRHLVRLVQLLLPRDGGVLVRDEEGLESDVVHAGPRTLALTQLLLLLLLLRELLVSRSEHARPVLAAVALHPLLLLQLCHVYALHLDVVLLHVVVRDLERPEVVVCRRLLLLLCHCTRRCSGPVQQLRHRLVVVDDLPLVLLLRE